MRKILTLIWGLALVCLLFVAWRLLDEPSTFVAGEIRTETLEMTVTHAPNLVLRFDRLRLGDHCRQGVAIRPANGSVIRYRRHKTGPLIVEVDRVEAITHGGPLDERPLALTEVKGYVDPASDCSSADLRLPVRGEATFGQPYNENWLDAYDAADLRGFPDPAAEYAPGLLLDARLTTFARANPLPLGLGSPWAFSQINQVSLPAGTVLGVGRQASSTGRAEPRPYWDGFARITPAATGESGFIVHAVTESGRIGFQAPASFIGPRQDQPYQYDELSATLVARLAGDPNLQVVLLLPIAIFTILTGANSLSGTLARMRAELMPQDGTPGRPTGGRHDGEASAPAQSNASRAGAGPPASPAAVPPTSPRTDPE